MGQGALSKSALDRDDRCGRDREVCVLAVLQDLWFAQMIVPPSADTALAMLHSYYEYLGTGIEQSSKRQLQA